MPHSGHTRSCKGGCGAIVTGTWWCPRCRAARGMKPAPKYGGAHQRKRKAERDSMRGRPCARCGRPLSGSIQLDHDDRDPTKWIGFSHAECNLSAGGRKGAAIANGARRAHAAPASAWHAPPEPERDPEWGDGVTRPDGTGRWRQHARPW